MPRGQARLRRCAAGELAALVRQDKLLPPAPAGSPALLLAPAEERRRARETLAPKPARNPFRHHGEGRLQQGFGPRPAPAAVGFLYRPDHRPRPRARAQRPPQAFPALGDLARLQRQDDGLALRPRPLSQFRKESRQHRQRRKPGSGPQAAELALLRFIVPRAPRPHRPPFRRRGATAGTRAGPRSRQTLHLLLAPARFTLPEMLLHHARYRRHPTRQHPPQHLLSEKDKRPRLITPYFFVNLSGGEGAVAGLTRSVAAAVRLAAAPATRADGTAAEIAQFQYLSQNGDSFLFQSRERSRQRHTSNPNETPVLIWKAKESFREGRCRVGWRADTFS
jgi:hypothetical protein